MRTSDHEMVWLQFTMLQAMGTTALQIQPLLLAELGYIAERILRDVA